MVALLSSSERAYISEGIDQDIRTDGRQRTSFRPFDLSLNPVSQAIGSARLKLGQTDVLVSIKADIGRPSLATPQKGSINCAVDCSAGVGGSSLEWDDRSLAERNSDLASILKAILCDSGALDLGALLIVDAKHCWVLFVDVLVLAFDGNLVDAIVLATKAAITTTTLPSVSIEESGEATEIVISSDPSSSKRLSGTDNIPVSVTLCQIGTSYIVDPSVAEEACASATLIMAFDKTGNVVFMRKTGAGSLEPGVLLDMVQTAQRIAVEIFVTFSATCVDQS